MRCNKTNDAAKLQDEKKKKKEEDERRRKEERAKKMAEFDKFKNPTGPNFVISKRGGGGGGGDGEVLNTSLRTVLLIRCYFNDCVTLYILGGGSV